jgi:aconitate hydratase
MMGILPLEFDDGTTWQSLGLTGEEVFDFAGLNDALRPGQTLKILATNPARPHIEFQAKVRIDTPVELDYYRNGGILQTVLRKLLRS